MVYDCGCGETWVMKSCPVYKVGDPMERDFVNASFVNGDFLYNADVHDYVWVDDEEE